ncbi:UDP-GlcNAc:undecaprenyl-phosphate GlcNAc-1-phosphate transferase [Phyllobacterium myrsinacearum]|uniref:MraY family glycosyltransferase n=1 Tax=Phyllobacterium myrsinacearum TaxID=28101 RepID=UPI00102A97E7|nr:MraY family glycosyltransferase [Phyllobacterium myrsinacearum]RZS79372.1 UDP-GlcNAc:undecaprenyl-phosphate GlcNAc-1-phosphate transferase [Phyllobacterium myrsinacearum]
MFFWFTSCLATLSMTVLLIGFLKKTSHALALVDYPDSRKQHENVVPLCGGIAIFSAFFLVSLFSRGAAPFPVSFWIGILMVLSIGVMDDRMELSARTRLVVQFFASAILVIPLAGPSIYVANMLPLALAGSALPVLTIIAILFVIGLINSWNMVDGVDGLAGGCAAAAIFWISLLSFYKGLGALGCSSLVLLAAVCGFLLFNMRSPWSARARIFLGDAGSTALGAVIAYLIITLSRRAEIAFPVLLWIVVVPVTDTMSLIVRRLHAGRNPLTADRWHLHHLLLDRSHSHAMTTNIIVASSALCGGVGVAGILAGASNYLMTFGLFVPVIIHSAFVFLASGAGQAVRMRPATMGQLNSIPPVLLRPEAGKNFGTNHQPVQPNPGILSDPV